MSHDDDLDEQVRTARLRTRSLTSSYLKAVLKLVSAEAGRAIKRTRDKFEDVVTFRGSDYAAEIKLAPLKSELDFD